MPSGELNYRIDERKLAQILKAIEGLSVKKRGQVLVDMMRKGGLLVMGKLKENISGRILKVRSGLLRSSIGTTVKNEANDIAAVIGSGVGVGERVVYANIHETGGTITPKNVSYLTIPLQAAMTPARVLRKSAREWSDTFVRKGVIFQNQGGKAVPLFLLRKSVNIPARHYMSRTLAESRSDVDKIMVRSVEEQLKKAV